MKNKLFLVFLFISAIGNAQRQTTYKIISDKSYQTIIDVQVGDMKNRAVSTPLGEALRVNVDQGSSLLIKGAPDLPKLSFSVIIPNQKNSAVEILESNYIEYDGYTVAPSKGKIYQDKNPADVPYIFGEAYSKNEFYPSTLVNLQKPHVIRDFRGQTIQLNPIQYNPITKKLRYYTGFKIKLSYDGISTENILANAEPPATIAVEYDAIYQNHFLNYNVQGTRYSPIKQAGTMLIYCPGDFLNEINPFVTWKKMKGTKVILVNTDTVAGGVNETNLYNMSKWYYQNHAIAYLLIVGDHAQIPALINPVGGITLLGPSDMANAYITSNDHYPEFIVGRFSGENVNEIRTQVNKTIQYEKYPNISNNWFQKQIGISSDQGPGDDNQMDYEHICNILDSNKNQYNYVNNKGYFDGTQVGCFDDAGYPSSTDIVTAINGGIGLINYCGHGSTQAFTTSGFDEQSVQAVTNSNGEWPFIFSTACWNGNFTNSTCLGELLLRAKNIDGKPQGAVATVMSSILQSWDPPMQGQDEMNAVMRGARSNNIRTTFGSIVASGLMSTMDNYNTFADPIGGSEIADTWIIFGDPSLEVRTKNEGQINCTHSGWMQQNSTEFYVGSSVNNALITLYYQNEILATAYAVNGLATFYFSPVVALDSIVVTATKQNYTPYFGKVDVVNYPTGVRTETQDKFILYPNPVIDELRITAINGFKIDGVRILDMTGRVLMQGLGSNSTMNTSRLASGNYLLQINSGYKKYTTSFSK